MVPFGVNQNGTELVYALLERAAQTGARYVADMKVYMTFRLRGSAVECRTAVMLEGDPRLDVAATGDATAAATGPYQTDVTAYQPQPVELVAEDRELVCHKVNVPVNKRRRVRESDRTADTGRLSQLAARGAWRLLCWRRDRYQEAIRRMAPPVPLAQAA